MLKVVLSGITVTVLVYVLLEYSAGVKSVLHDSTQAYDQFAKTARGE